MERDRLETETGDCNNVGGRSYSELESSLERCRRKIYTVSLKKKYLFERFG